MRRLFALLLVLGTMACAQPAAAQISIGINAPGFSIGINLPVYPDLQVVPGYPVYYAPNVNGDYFFYDGFYWVFNVGDGQWYSSSWYNGPWVYVEPYYVPQPILVIPYRYYRVRPAYWNGWAYDAPPRWGQHWGRDWEVRRANWDHWDRNRAPAPAPLPVYQKNYPRDRYPAPAQQVIIHNEHYKYQAKDAQVQQERAAIFRKQSAGGERATAKAERVEHPTATAPARGERQQRQETAPPPARSQRHETAQPPAAPRQEAPPVERAQPERGRRSEPQRAEPQNGAQPAPQQAPRRERPQQETAQPPAAPRHEAPAQQPQQPPRAERPQAQQPAQQPAVRQAPPAAQPPAKEERQEQREERQQERGNDRKQ